MMANNKNSAQTEIHDTCRRVLGGKLGPFPNFAHDLPGSFKCG